MVAKKNSPPPSDYVFAGREACLLLPTSLYETLVNEAAQEDIKAKALKSSPSLPFSFRDRENAGDLACIRAGTAHDLDDAKKLAEKIFKRTKSSLDDVTLEFSKDLFIAVTLYFSYNEKNCTFPLMLSFLSDPAWDDARQIFSALGNAYPGLSPSALGFLRVFYSQTETFWSGSKNMVSRCEALWRDAFSRTGKIPKEKKPARAVPIFNPEEIVKALTRVGDLREESRAGGERVLTNAKYNGGNRTVPDARKAGLKLEEAKSKFENLVEPIARLQTDLVLASAMKPEDFRITPLLLLGDPGIGKTYLAMQLADALGVKMDKLSAGSAQGGFQLTGSHPTWHNAQPGSLFVLLAEGQSAAPVVVIDEVDKIVDNRFPVLPVLLDLFEDDTARSFKDEYFGMQFDASRIVFILTANSLDGVPAPLLSRLEVFDVPRPEPAQRLRIIKAEAERLRRKTKTQIELDAAVCNDLAERVDIDLRKTGRLVKEAFSKAMVTGERVARFPLPRFEGRRSIGFGC